MDFDSIHMTQDEIVIAGLKTEESHPFMPQKEKHFSGTLENWKDARIVKKKNRLLKDLKILELPIIPILHYSIIAKSMLSFIFNRKPKTLILTVKCQTSILFPWRGRAGVRGRT
jgi:hypothetical protein